MTDTELNKKVHKLIGLCWHEFVPSDDNLEWSCEHCSKLDTGILNSSINLLTWEGFGIAWEWIQRHERRGEFLDYCMAQVYHSWDCIPIDIHTILPLPENIVSPRALSEAIVEFFKEAK